ncbi:GntR family transcriptional regulator [Phenylobacterium terrae]|uniref:GntR family transcriptional regulator n=1 Tax=Phenylobacterium terrae TaxID=2665495 RepID=A0ABW4N690_9CAUL
MNATRREPFQLALAELRRRLAAGTYPPGTRLAAADLAGELGLSATPIREALARLAGEGLLDERRGEGAFLPLYAGQDVADLYRLSQAHLQAALQGAHVDRPANGLGAAILERPADAASAVVAADRLFAGWVAEQAGRRLALSFGRLQLQLAPVRRLEPLCLPDLTAEWARLAAADRGGARERLAAVRQFHARRVRMAGRLADALAGGRPAIAPL